MTDTTQDDLVKRLRDLGDHASFEPHMHHAAADLIEELEAKLSQQDDLVQAAVAAALTEAINRVNGCDRVSEVQPAILTLLEAVESRSILGQHDGTLPDDLMEQIEATIREGSNERSEEGE